jgi:hypothetical protein
MRGLPRRHMRRLAQAIMIACAAALGTALRAEGAPPLLSPGLRQLLRTDLPDDLYGGKTQGDAAGVSAQRSGAANSGGGAQPP